VRHDQHIPTIPSLWVITRSKDDDGKINGGRVKARLVVQGNLDYGVQNTPTDSPTVDRHSVKLILSVASNNKWKVRSMDVSAAFLQGRKIDRVVHVEPPKEFKRPGYVWRLRKGLYGLRGASRLWYEELSKDLEARGGKKMIGEPACFLFHKDGKFVGAILIHVDDIIATGDEWFQRNIFDGIKKRFKISKNQEDSFTYTGMAIWTDAQGCIHLNQNKYIEELEELPLGVEDGKTEEECKAIVRRVVGKLLYLSLTRPDLSFRTNMLSRVQPGVDSKSKVKDARELIACVKRSKVEIKFGVLGSLDSLHLEVYADAAFGNVEDKTRSTEGAVIVLKGLKGTGSVIYWRSRVIARVCRSAKSAETNALEDALDCAINIGRQIHQIRTGRIEDKSCRIIGKTDSKGLVESLKLTKQVEECRMRLNVARIKEYLELKEVDRIDWIPTTMMLADSLTKARTDATKLVRILETGKLE